MDFVISSSLITGTVLGIVITLSVTWRYFKYGELTVQALGFVLVGLMLVGLSIWKSIDISWSKGEGRIYLRIVEQQAAETKRDTYDFFTERINKLNNIITTLRRENLLLRKSRLRVEPERYIQEVYFGRIQDSEGMPISDVKIEELGGGQVFSNVNGEYYLSSQAGHLVRFERNGYETKSINLTDSQMGTYQTIVLQRKEEKQ